MHMSHTKFSRFLLFLLRVLVGWFLLYQGITAFLNPNWSLFSFIGDAQLFPEFYESVLDQSYVAAVTLAVKVTYIVVGALLMLGLFTRPAALLGAVLVLFFYFARLAFPYVNETYYIVDPNLILAVVLLYLFAARAGEVFGIKKLFRRSSHE
jgi:thiosulfate dehydrogenase (quinone) large subunit